MEIFKDVKGYEGIYQVSNYGNVKSLARKGRLKDRIFNNIKHKSGYLTVTLSINNNIKTCKIHQLVAIAFLNHTPNRYNGLIVDHINNIKTDNRLENLQLTTARNNVSKDRKNKVSKYTGVSWYKRDSVWVSMIRVNGKQTYLGRFSTELEASNAYQKALSSL